MADTGDNAVFKIRIESDNCMYVIMGKRVSMLRFFTGLGMVWYGIRATRIDCRGRLLSLGCAVDYY